MNPIIAFALSSTLTCLDLDRIFNIPGSTAQKAKLYAWWWGFVLVNGCLAAVLFLAIRDTEPLRSLNQTLLAAATGLTYLAIIRSKFSTFSLGTQEVPFGLEAFYNAGRDAAFRRINAIARSARETAVLELSDSSSLEQLARRTRNAIENDALLSPVEQGAAKQWLLSVLGDGKMTDEEKRDALSRFILFGGHIAE